jgi:hypothetical protein
MGIIIVIHKNEIGLNLIQDRFNVVNHIVHARRKFRIAVAAPDHTLRFDQLRRPDLFIPPDRGIAALLAFRHYQQMNFMALLSVFQERSGTAGFDIVGMGPYGKDLHCFPLMI